MSTKLTKALEFANYRVTMNNQKAALLAKTESLLSYSINGGTFTIDLQLLTFCKQLIDEQEQEVVLLDIYKNPILVELESFYEEIRSRYFEASSIRPLSGMAMRSGRTRRGPLPPLAGTALPVYISSSKRVILSSLRPAAAVTSGTVLSIRENCLALRLRTRRERD